MLKFLIFSTLFLPCFAGEEFYMPIAAAAYSDDPNQCWSNVLKHEYSNNTAKFSIYRKYSAKCASLNDTCFGYIAIDNYYDPIIYIVFRGTNNNYQLFENGWNYNEMVPFVSGGKVSKIFFDGFNALWNAGMKDDLLTLKNKYYPDVEFYFIGHSLGGAMASLAAATFLKNNINLEYVDLVTFGQPRTGDKDFAIGFESLGFRSTARVVHKADIVPHLPSFDRSVYRHHTEEWWYNNDMGHNDCPVLCDAYNGEDSKCSNSVNEAKHNMNDHKYYYGRNVMEYGKSGCPDLATLKDDIRHKNTNPKIHHIKRSNC